jgi:hypothetical protein
MSDCLKYLYIVPTTSSWDLARFCLTANYCVACLMDVNAVDRCFYLLCAMLFPMPEGSFICKWPLQCSTLICLAQMPHLAGAGIDGGTHSLGHPAITFPLWAGSRGGRSRGGKLWAEDAVREDAGPSCLSKPRMYWETFILQHAFDCKPRCLMYKTCIMEKCVRLLFILPQRCIHALVEVKDVKEWMVML